MTKTSWLKNTGVTRLINNMTSSDRGRLFYSPIIRAVSSHMTAFIRASVLVFRGGEGVGACIKIQFIPHSLSGRTSSPIAWKLVSFLHCKGFNRRKMTRVCVVGAGVVVKTRLSFVECVFHRVDLLGVTTPVTLLLPGWLSGCSREYREYRP